MTMTTPIEALVQQHLPLERGLLDPSSCVIGSDLIWADVTEAIARNGVAPDHWIGERPLAFFSFMEAYPDKFDDYLFITDRRMMGQYARISGGPAEVHLRYSWIQGTARERKLLTDKLKVMHGNQTIDLSFGVFNDKLEAFFNDIVALPPEQREPPLKPLVQPSEQDPTGARYAISTLMDQDARAHFLLNYVERASVGGLMPVDIAIDLVTRLTVQHRNESCGRGVYQESWMSPLGRDDLSYALTQVYGNPLYYVEEPYRTFTFDSRNRNRALMDGLDKVLEGVDMVMNGLDTAAACADVADDVLSLNVGGLAGRAIAGALGPKDVVNFTITVADNGSFGSYRLFDQQRPLSAVAPLLVDDVNYTLDALESAILLRRCAYGWEHSVQDLLAAPLHDVMQRLTATMGQFQPVILRRRALKERLVKAG